MRHLVLLSVLLLGATWAVAQTDQASPSQTSPTQTSPAPDQASPSEATPDQSSASQTSNDQTTVGTGNATVQGCLSGSDGNYTLTDDNGTAYQLTGNTAKLSDHVGHEIKVMGTTAAAPASGSSDSGGTMGNSSSSQTLQVNSFKHVSKTCKNSGMSH
jgi:hypothetical protein